MSLTIEEWFEKDMDYSSELEKSIPRLNNAQVKVWDFENNEIKLDRKRIGITLLVSNKNADTYQRRAFMDVQKTILSQMGNREISEGVDLSNLKYQFEQECWEYRTEERDIEDVISTLKNKYDEKLISSWSDDGCIPYSTLYIGMQEYDYTSPGTHVFNRGHSSMAHIAEGECARLYNDLAEKKTVELAEQALTSACYLGFRKKNGRELGDKSDADSRFLAQLDCCKKSLLEMLDLTPEELFREQYILGNYV